jgi:hypothetical protein
MNAGELMELLKDVPADTIVIMSADGEGNGYSPLADADIDSAYDAETTWSGDVHLRELTDELRAQGYSEEDVAGPGAVPCVVLWPTR